MTCGNNNISAYKLLTRDSYTLKMYPFIGFDLGIKRVNISQLLPLLKSGN